MKLPGTKMKDLPPGELEAILQRLPELRAHFSEHSAATLDARTADAKRFIHGQAADDDDLASKHKALHEAQLEDARQALRQPCDIQRGPPAKPDREEFTPRPGHEWLTKEEAAALLECDQRELRTKAATVEVRAHQGRVQYKASEILELAQPLHQKNAVRQT